MHKQQHRQPQVSVSIGGVRQRRPCAGAAMVMMAKPPEAAMVKDTRVDPAAVEAALVEEDKNVYLGLFALQLLPSLLIGQKFASFLYFGLLAVSTVYLGAKRQDIPDEGRNPISTQQALGAPIAASASLFGVFAILKYTDISVGVAYQWLTTLLAVGASVSVLPPVLRRILPEKVVDLPVSKPLDAALAKAFPKTWEDDDQPLLDFAELAVLLSAISAAFVYINPDVGLSAKFLIPNVFAWCIGMQSIGLISISSFSAAAILLAGLFCYDIFWVFGTEVMMTVATRIEAPVKFLFPALTDPSKQYPFSVLGLGDVVIPATFCTLMRSFDKKLEGAKQAEAAAARALAEQVSSKNPVALWLDSFLGAPVAKKAAASAVGGSAAAPGAGSRAAMIDTTSGGDSRRSYFDNSVAAYAFGLGLCFAVNFVSRSGQPALLYLNPALLTSAFATALLNGNGELQQLLSFGLGGTAVVGTIPPDDLWHKGDDFGGGATSDGFGLWSRRRRKVGGGGGDVAVEFLDVREAALVSVVEALARRALPWQAQLCPRALQDLEIARVRVFHASQKKRQADCVVRQDETLKGSLMEEERAWELFARAQGELFERALDQIADLVQGCERNHAAYVRAQAERRRKRVQLEEREEQRSTVALEAWNGELACATRRLDASMWLEAAGARALASQEHARWRQGVSDVVAEDGNRAEADRAEERRRSSDRCSSVLQAARESDQMETMTSEKSWNLQGWLSVGSHKLVQQTLRALVRRCSHPYEVRNILWEARQAAEFSAAARAAAVSQRAEDSQGLSDVRRHRKKLVRQHRRDLLVAEDRRATAEDAERARAANHAVEMLFNSSAETNRDEIYEIYERVQAERSRALAAREAEVDRSKLFRAAMAGLQDELDRETERLSLSVKERWEEENEQIAAEVMMAASSLKEEKARADDREALLKETLLREREKEDRMLNIWLMQQEQKGDETVRQQVSDARKTLLGDRNQWIGDVTGSIARLADLDASCFSNPLSWSNGYNQSCTPEVGDRAAASWAGILARHHQEYSPDAGTKRGGAAAQQHGPDEAENNITTLPQPDPDTAAAEIESLAAGRRSARLEAVANLALQGLLSHWRAFFRDEIERTRLAATALDLTASQWAQRQRRAVGALRASWRGRDCQSTMQSDGACGACGDGGAVATVGASARGGCEEKDGVVRDAGAASKPSKKEATSTSPAVRGENERTYSADTTITVHPSIQAKGHETPSEKEGEASFAIGAEADTATSGVDGAANGGSDRSQEGSGQTATGPDVLRLGGDGGDDASALSCVVNSIDDDDRGLEHNREAAWLRAVQYIAGDRTEVDLATIGSAVGALPGGAAVLCLAHDCLVGHDSSDSDSSAYAGGLVRTDVLLSATLAFIALRRSIRAAAAEGGEGGCRADRRPDNAAAANGTFDRGDETPAESTTDGDTHGLKTAEIAAIAQVEVAVELGVYGDALCADLAAISTSPNLSRFPPDIGSPTPPSQQPPECRRVRLIRWAVEKHSSLLSPQSVFALTALLSAKAQDWEGRHISCDDNGTHVRRADVGGLGPRDEGEGVDSSPPGDPTAWNVALSDSLVAVRTASLEHLALWASACDRGRLDSACVAEVLAEVASSSSVTSSVGADATVAAAVADIGHDRDCVSESNDDGSGGGGGAAQTWAMMHKASGVGFSPLMLLAATLSDNNDDEGYAANGDLPSPSLCPSQLSSVRRGADQSSVGDDNGDGDTDGGIGAAGNRDCSGEVSAEVAFTKSAVRSALRLLSPASLRNISQCLSSQQPRTNQGEDSPPATRGEQGCSNTSDKPRLAEDSNGGHEVLGGIPGHPAIGDLSCLDDETLKTGMDGVVGALDARCAGQLPPAVLAVALQSGEAGFRLEPLQAQVVLRLSGCLETKWPKKDDGDGGQRTIATAAHAVAEDECDEDFGYLGCPPRTPGVRYSTLVNKLPGLLRLIQGAHRLAKAASGAASSTQPRAYARLKQRSSLLEAPRLEAIHQLTSKAMSDAASAAKVRAAENARRAEQRSSLLEAPRLEAIHQLTSKAMSDAASAAKVRAAENARRAEVRKEFTSAIKARIAVTNPSGGVMVGVRKARAAASSELCAAGQRATEQAMLSQDAAEMLFEEASTLGLSMGSTWEEDARQCEHAFAESEKRLDVVMAELEERRTASREAANDAANREATSGAASARTPPSPSSLQSSPSPEPRRTQTQKQQADFAEVVKMRHHCVSLCRETLSWLGTVADNLEAECAELCDRAAGLPERMEKRLSTVLKTAEAKGVEERSIVVKRLHAGSKGWRDKILDRKQRWEELRTSGRSSFEGSRARREAERGLQHPPRLGVVASAARTVVLAQELHMAGEPIRRFLDSAGNGPRAVDAAQTVEAAAAAMPRAHLAVRSVVAAAAGRGGMGEQGEEEPGDCTARADGGGPGMNEGAGRGAKRSASAEVEAKVKANGGCRRGGAAAADVLAMEREDAVARASACREALGGWWERQRAAVEEGLLDREKEAADRRTMREVHYVLSETVMTEIEHRDKAEMHRKRTTGLALSEAKRIAEQFVDALRSANGKLTQAAADAKREVAEETEVLMLEAQSLSAKVSAALQRGLNAATDDLVAARGKSTRANNGGREAAATAAVGRAYATRAAHEENEEDYGESVYGMSTTDGSAEAAQQSQQQRGGEYFAASSSASASASDSASASASASVSASASASGPNKSNYTSCSDSSPRHSRLERVSFRKGAPRGGGGRGG
eukprot:g7506.t1